MKVSGVLVGMGLISIVVMVSSMMACGNEEDEERAGKAGTGGTGGKAGAGGEAGTEHADACSSMCKAATQCPEDDWNECLAECAALLDLYSVCESSLTSAIQCQSTQTYTCSEEGFSNSEDGCFEEITAAAQCLTCLPTEEDHACLACIKQHCCEEIQSLLVAEGREDFEECQDSCFSNPVCIKQCEADYPEMAAVIQAIDTCGNSHCSLECEGWEGED